MESRKHEAAEKKRCGRYNCAQAVLCTYCDKAGLDEGTCFLLGHSFAAGMGSMDGTCGALVGAGMVLGLVNKDKVLSVKQMRQIMNNFKERNGSTRCRDLKGIDTKQILRSCPDCVADAAEFLEEFLPDEP